MFLRIAHTAGYVSMTVVLIVPGAVALMGLTLAAMVLLGSVSP
jgi:hypothetical protein